MKTLTINLLFLSSILLVGAALAQPVEVYPTIPGTSVRDYTKPGYIIDGAEAYQTIPGTSVRDYTRPGYVIEGGAAYPTLPGTSVRDYSRPGYLFDSPPSSRYCYPSCP